MPMGDGQPFGVIKFFDGRCNLLPALRLCWNYSVPRPTSSGIRNAVGLAGDTASFVMCSVR